MPLQVASSLVSLLHSFSFTMLSMAPTAAGARAFASEMATAEGWYRNYAVLKFFSAMECPTAAQIATEFQDERSPFCVADDKYHGSEDGVADFARAPDLQEAVADCTWLISDSVTCKAHEKQEAWQRCGADEDYVLHMGKYSRPHFKQSLYPSWGSGFAGGKNTFLRHIKKLWTAGVLDAKCWAPGAVLGIICAGNDIYSSATDDLIESILELREWLAKYSMKLKLINVVPFVDRRPPCKI